MQLSHIAHVRIAYFTHARVGYDFVCDGDRACRATVEFQDRLQTLIDCAHEQDGNFHDSWRQNSDAFTSVGIQGGLSSRTYAYTIIYSC